MDNISDESSYQISRKVYDGVDWLSLFGFSDDYLGQERLLGLQKNGFSESWRENLAPTGTREYHEKGFT